MVDKLFVKRLVVDFLKSIIVFILTFLKVTAEFMVTVFFSFFPVILSAVLDAAFTNSSWLNAFLGNFSYGQAFMYTSAFLSSYVIWRWKENDKGRLFKEFCFYLFLYSLFVGGFLYALISTSNGMKMPVTFNLDNVKYFGVSVIMGTVLVWYCCIWDNYHEPIDGKAKAKEDMESIDKALDESLGGN